jgi:hypothetical protein
MSYLNPQMSLGDGAIITDCDIFVLTVIFPFRLSFVKVYLKVAGNR